ncbi:MAG: VCBS repeat-containing protein [Myxococcaceae bacterium]|nr:VCBS repeat-containing protein [Myxococcaceae bacterium]
MNVIKVLVLLGAGAVSTMAVTACTPPVRPCSSSSCPGCCDANGQCQSGLTITACGSQGNECRVCSTNQTCNSGQCSTANTTGGGSATGGGVAGGASGGGTAGGATGGGAAGGMTSCSSGFTACGLRCVATQSDFDNCGACGRSCGINQYCSNGQCAAVPASCGPAQPCPTNYYCDPSNSMCVFGCRDNADCRGGRVCEMNTKRCECPTGTNLCGSSCVPESTPTACGASCLDCSVANGVGTCSQGVCGFTCAAGYHRCGNRCVSNFDVLTCGTSCQACVIPPNATSTCDGNVCDFVCAAGFHKCGQDCVSNFDVATCGNACQPCQAPANGVAQCMSPGGGQPPACTFQCNPGFVRCGSQCVTESATACGATCQTCTPPAGATNPQCVNGQCQYTCAMGFHTCNNACVTNLSPATCGMSCSPCPTPANGTATCDGTSCGVQCNVGFHECNGQCVSNFNTNTCGSRCAPCPDGPVGSGTTVTCDGTNCGLRCGSVTTPNYCNNVCVADSITSCGPSCLTCTAPANATATCVSGTCDFTCQSGYHRCGTQCLPDNSPSSCGTSCSACPAGPPNTTTTCTRSTPTAPFACGWDCGPGTNRCTINSVQQCVPADLTLACGPTCAVCSSAVALERGVCGTNGICTTGCITQCAGACVNAQTSAAHCGACNTACTGNDRCSEGQCRAFCASGVGLSSMLPSVTTTTSAFPFLVLDVNGDGRNDLVVAENYTLYVRLGLANAAGTGPSGTFSTTAVQTALNYNPAQLVAGDLTGDGLPELLVLSTTTNVDVLRNLGAGSFTRSSIIPSSLAYGASLVPTSATIGEFTGAGPADVVFSFNTSLAAQSAALFSGNGLTTNPITVTGSAGLGIGTISNVRAALVNADGFTDLIATAASNAVYVYPGTGSASAPFNAPMAVLAQLGTGESFTSGTAGSSFMMDVADVTADGVPDVVVPVVAGGSTFGVRVFPLTSAPAFGASSLLALPSVSRALVAADVNGDGRRDVVAGTTDVRVFPSQVGGFAMPQVLAISFGATFFNSLAVADVTGDARPEIFAPSGNTIVTAVNNGTGGFAGVQGASVPNATRITAGDLNGDGFTDVAANSPSMSGPVMGTNIRLVDTLYTTNSVRGRVEVFYNGAWGTVCNSGLSISYEIPVLCRSLGLSSAVTSYTTPSPSTPPGISGFYCASSSYSSWQTCTHYASTCTNVSDLGIECLVTGAVSQDSTTQVLYGSGTGAFTTGPSFTTRGDRGAIGELNGDTREDLVTAGLGAVDGGTGFVVEVRFGAMGNTLSAPLQLPVRAAPTFLAIGEVSNDTRNDIVVGSNLGVEVLVNLGSNMFAPAQPLLTTTSVSSLALSDLNLDGRRDIVVASASFNRLEPWLNVGLPGNAGFLAGTAISPSISTNFSVLAGDVTYDGKPDLVFGRFVYAGNGAGGFTQQTSTMPTQPPRQVLADLDNSGSLDLIGAGSASSVLSVLSGTSSTAFGFAATPSAYSPGSVVEDVALARFNTDAQRDLVVLVGPQGSRAVVAAPGVCR